MQKHILKKVLKKLNEAILNENPIIPQFDLEQERAYSRKNATLKKVEDQLESSYTIMSYILNLLETKYKKSCIDTIMDILLENYHKHNIDIAFWEGDLVDFRLENATGVSYNTRTKTFTTCYPSIIQLFPKDKYLSVMGDIAKELYGQAGIREDEWIPLPDKELEDVLIDDDLYWNAEVNLDIQLKTEDEIDTMTYLIKKIWAAQDNEGVI